MSLGDLPKLARRGGQRRFHQHRQGEGYLEDRPERRVLRKAEPTGEPDIPYWAVFGDVSKIIDAARESAARSVMPP